MKVSYSMCDPHEDTDIILSPVRHFDWHIASDEFTHRRNGPWPRAPRFWGPLVTLPMTT